MGLTYLYQLQDVDFAYLLDNPAKIAVIDMDDAGLTARQIDTLQARDQVLMTYLSVGEAEDYRDYWRAGGWSAKAPDFLLAENPDWSGNYRVEFWDPAWQRVMFDSVKEVVGLGYDGIYLDIVDAYTIGSVEARYDGADIRQEMIDFVIALSDYARELDPDFLIVPQNATGLLAESDGSPARPNEAYLRAIDGIGVEDLWYDDDAEADWTTWDLEFIELARAADKFVLATSYPASSQRQADFVERALAADLVPYVGTRDLDDAVPRINLATPDRIGRRDLDLPSPQVPDGAGSELHRIGGPGADALTGGVRDDRLHGGGGPDLLRGHAGDDRLYGGPGHDRINGGAGDDLAFGGGGRDILLGGWGDDTLVGGPGRDQLLGGPGGDRLVFDRWDSILSGGGGVDTLAVQGAFDLDLGEPAFRAGFETLDLSNGARNVARIGRDDILRKAGDDTLFVTGDRVDIVRTDMGRRDGVEQVDGITYAMFESGGATLYLELGLTVSGDGADWL